MSSPEFIVYVAGAFSPTKAQKAARGGVLDKIAWRECVEENIMVAKKLGVEVSKLGVCPFIPHANTDLPEFEDTQPYEFWIKATAEQLRRCNAVIFTDEWMESSGARGENDIAVAHDIHRFFSIQELESYIKENLA